MDHKVDPCPQEPYNWTENTASEQLISVIMIVMEGQRGKNLNQKDRELP